MCPYLYLSSRNPCTVIQSNIRILWSRRRSSCIPTPASLLSTSCCSCILNAGCCWVGRVLGRSHNIFSILASRGVLFILLTVVSSSVCAAVVPARCGPFSLNWGWRRSRHGRGGGAATVPSLFFFLFTTPSPGCWSLAIRGCGSVSALFGYVWMLLWRRLFLNQLLQPCHLLTDHVRQFPWRLRFPTI